MSSTFKLRPPVGMYILLNSSSSRGLLDFGDLLETSSPLIEIDLPEGACCETHCISSSSLSLSKTAPGKTGERAVLTPVAVAPTPSNFWNFFSSSANMRSMCVSSSSTVTGLLRVGFLFSRLPRNFRSMSLSRSRVQTLPAQGLHLLLPVGGTSFEAEVTCVLGNSPRLLILSLEVHPLACITRRSLSRLTLSFGRIGPGSVGLLDSAFLLVHGEALLFSRFSLGKTKSPIAIP
mmetsp:Transcript_8622/g.12865  ORF Transcript_8622/g.12865 Transcript_8622/m.12865 type:complete len:234 (-) Transcript_8622:1121-1822(-)